jgi:heavy metal sensor kinase
VSRIPIRLRLALVFGLATALVLALAGALLYVRLGSSLDEAIDEGLEARLADVVALAGSGAPPGGPAPDADERLAQVLDRAGRVVAAVPGGTAAPPALAPAELALVRAGPPTRFERRDVPGAGVPLRLLAVEAADDRVVVVGASLEDRDEALQELLGQLLVVGPVSLVLVSLLGYAVATAALRPVETMRSEAAKISAAEPGLRLPVPPARDEIRRLAVTLNGMLERLEDALARERSFVADASHELRTPLALLRAELELALRRPRPAAELEQALRSAATQAERLTRLADDLLVLARADHEGIPLRCETFPAEELLETVSRRFGPHAAAAGRAVVVAPPRDVLVDGDRVRLEQALANLVGNALEHGRGDVVLAAASENGRVELHVRDRGSGFEQDFLPRAFDRFSRADNARSGDGAGLGLALVDAVARAHGGEAGARNRSGGGADVWLSLPASTERDRG